MDLVDRLDELLPPHAAGLSLEHNLHKNVYESVEDHYQYLSADDWVSEAERLNAIATDSVWVLQWYPETPVGFHWLAASTLRALLTHLAKDLLYRRGVAELAEHKAP